MTRTRTAVLSIENLTSDAFSALTQALKAVPGVESVSFSVERSVASVDFDPNQSSIDDLLRAVLKAGHKVL
ncbi:MAG: heavy-metal-associated domain-containing protein [Candidatus Binatia bacterium]